jgi:hypothetical protein
MAAGEEILERVVDMGRDIVVWRIFSSSLVSEWSTMGDSEASNGAVDVTFTWCTGIAASV